MRRAFFVVGWEGSGTYMMRDALVAAGCHAEGWHDGRHDNYKFYDMPDLLAFRRSLPHGGMWSLLRHIERAMERAGYDVTQIAMMRDWNASIQSVLRRDSARNAREVENNMRQALFAMAMGRRTNLIMVSYEAFCLSEGFRKWLFERLELPYPEDYEIKFANEKYYE